MAWFIPTFLHSVFLTSIFLGTNNHLFTIAIQTTDASLINAETNAQLESLLSTTAPGEPVVFRVDELTDALVNHATNGIVVEQERVRFVMNGLGVTELWSDVLFDPATGQSDLSLFVAALLGLLPGTTGIKPYPGLLESRQEALALQETETPRNFTDEIQDYYNLAVATYVGASAVPLPSPQLDVAPIYQVSYGYSNATNAKTTGPFSSDALLLGLAGRCNIHLNLGAHRMLEPTYFGMAILHETWHCFHALPEQNDSLSAPPDLLQRALREGVATYLAFRILVDYYPDAAAASLTNADALFWSQEEWEAAETRRAEIVMAFAQARTLTDRAQQQEWMVLGKPLSSVLGAPSRTAYYVGLLAVQAYVDRLPEEDSDSSSNTLAKELLDLNDSSRGRETIFQALLHQEDVSPPGQDSSSGGNVHEAGFRRTSVSLVTLPLLSIGSLALLDWC